MVQLNLLQTNLYTGVSKLKAIKTVELSQIDQIKALSNVQKQLKSNLFERFYQKDLLSQKFTSDSEP